MDRTSRRLLTVTALAGTLVLAACGQTDDPDPGPTAVAQGGTLTATPLDVESPELEPTEVEPTAPEPVEDATDGDGPTDDGAVADGEGQGEPEPTDTEPTDTEPTDTAPAGPTDADRARFVAEYRPADAAELQHVAADATGDGEPELVFAWVGEISGRSHVAVAAWGEAGYAITWQDEGGSADQLGRIRVADVNADGLAEVVVIERRGGERSSASLWSVAGPTAVTPLVAEGGCHDGSTTFGVAGVNFFAGADGAEEIHATCDESPLPPTAWRSDVYVWEDGAYRARETNGE